MKEYIAYFGGWENGSPVVVGIPTYGDTNMSSTNGTVAELTAANPEVFNNIYTFFAGSSINVANANTIGFPRVIQFTQNQTLYFSETNYIKCVNNNFANNLLLEAYSGSTLLLRWAGSRDRMLCFPPLNPDRSNFTINEILQVYDISVSTMKCSAGRLSSTAFPGPNAQSVLNTSAFFEGIEPYGEDTDPYAPGGNSETGGGTGTFDLSSDSIDFPSLPTLTAVSTGLVSIYTPTLTQLNSLASFLWNANPTDVDWWKKLVANPLDLILGLSIVPVAVPAGASQNIKVGLIDTGVAMTKAATQFVTVDCGSINVAEVWGSALDYSPFTKFSIYLPFIGTRTINTDDIMGKTVHVKYNVDLLSGACTAMVKCGGSVLYQYSGACAISLPLTGETFTSMITSTIQLAASLGATVASGGAAAGITAASAANSVMSMKPQIERAGGVSGAAGQLGIMTPYLIAEVPRQSVPARYNTFAGYPSNINAVLGDLTGYTEIETIYIKGISATKTELDEIETLLKAGVII